MCDPLKAPVEAEEHGGEESGDYGGSGLIRSRSEWDDIVLSPPVHHQSITSINSRITDCRREANIDDTCNAPFMIHRH
jgi:hypothetical protein